MEKDFKERFTLANLLVHFVSMVIGIIASLVIMIFFVLDAKYAPKEETKNALVAIRAQQTAEAIGSESVESQLRRDIVRLESAQMESVKFLNELRDDISGMKKDIAVLVERSKSR